MNIRGLPNTFKSIRKFHKESWTYSVFRYIKARFEWVNAMANIIITVAVVVCAVITIIVFIIEIIIIAVVVLNVSF